jgi:D-methionine transport system ATP-binding protein
MEPIIKIENLSKDYKIKNGILHALIGINIDIFKGDIYGIIGLSGAGKSTLIRCINLLEKPTDGSIIFDGKDLTKINKKELLKERQKIGMIFQNFNLLDQRNVYKNVAYPLEIAGVKKEAAKDKILSLLNIVGLSDKIYSYPSELSGGQKQRVAIARALANDPSVLLCDEPTSALDPNTTNQILDLLKKINKELGVTIIIITHEMRIIDAICNKVSIIDNS